MEENLPKSKRKQRMEIYWGDQQKYEQDASAGNVSSFLPHPPHVILFVFLLPADDLWPHGHFLELN